MPGLRWKPVMTLLLCGDPPGLCQITLGLRWDQTLVTDILTRSARMACAKLDSTVRILTTLEHLSCCCHPALHGDSLWPEVVMQSLLVAYNILQMYDGCFTNQMCLNINLEWNRSNACYEKVKILEHTKIIQGWTGHRIYLHVCAQLVVMGQLFSVPLHPCSHHTYCNRKSDNLKVETLLNRLAETKHETCL